MEQVQKNITILGSTGSVGCSTLDIISHHRDKFSIFALTTNKNIELLIKQCQQFNPQHVVIVDETSAKSFAKNAQALNLSCQIHVGKNALVDVTKADDVEIVMAAIVGAAGLPATLAAAQSGKIILLANKEVLVMTGALFMAEAKKSGAKILPVDSEHNAIYQCLPAKSDTKSLSEMGVRRLILTASGGPFRKLSLKELESVTPEQACAHPTWSMGAKISVDSATMMNKGLEVIEAVWLFKAKLEEIDVIMQPQSIIHSMVEYIDGSFLAELGVPDMRTPIAYVLGLPTRISTKVKPLNFVELGKLEFYPLDLQRYPLMQLAYDAIETGGSASTCLNAANEVAVNAFLNKEISFLQINQIVEQTLNSVNVQNANTIETILAVDEETRKMAMQLIKSL